MYTDYSLLKLNTYYNNFHFKVNKVKDVINSSIDGDIELAAFQGS